MIRRAEPDDTEWIRETAARVYAPLGDYRPIMAGWLELPGVTAYLDCDERTRVRRGFVLVGFYEAGGAPADLEQPGHPLPGTPLVADLIAIGVEPRFQRGGSGARLMGHALDLAFEAQKRTPVGQMLLTVAKTNKPALALFKRFGFEIVDAAHGSYDGGQPALRLGRRLDR